MTHAPDTGEGRVIELDYGDYGPMRNGSDDIHIFQIELAFGTTCYTSHRMHHFQVRISTCDFPLSGILHGATFFI
jgi:hypothetical protein